MADINSDLIGFVTNQIGQLVLIIGGIVAGIKYLDKRTDDKIEEKVKGVRTDICSQLQLMKLSLEKSQELTDKSIEYIEKAIDRLEKEDE